MPLARKTGHQRSFLERYATFSSSQIPGLPKHRQQRLKYFVEIEDLEFILHKNASKS